MKAIQEDCFFTPTDNSTPKKTKQKQRGEKGKIFFNRELHLFSLTVHHVCHHPCPLLRHPFCPNLPLRQSHLHPLLCLHLRPRHLSQLDHSWLPPPLFSSLPPQMQLSPPPCACPMFLRRPSLHIPDRQ